MIQSEASKISREKQDQRALDVADGRRCSDGGTGGELYADNLEIPGGIGKESPRASAEARNTELCATVQKMKTGPLGSGNEAWRRRRSEIPTGTVGRGEHKRTVAEVGTFLRNQLGCANVSPSQPRN